MDDTMPVSTSRVPVTPTTMIVTRGILPPSVSSQTTCFQSFKCHHSTNNIPSLVIGPTQAMSASCISTINKKCFFIQYVIDGHDKCIGCFSVDVPCIECQFREHFGSLPSISLGRRSYSSVIPIHREWGFPIFHP
jgi:hypothetical protein